MQRKKLTWLLDIEVFPNAYFCGIRDYHSGEEITFEVSQWRDERKQFYQVMSNFDGFLVTFNGVSYDTTIIAFIIKNFARLRKLSVHDFCRAVKQFNDAVIGDDFERIKSYKWWKRPWIDIDMYLYWSKNLRISKQLSLKALAVQLDWDEIQELPYAHDTHLTKEELEIVKRYNLRNDVGILGKLFERMKEDVELRQYIKKEYGLTCWSMDAPKVAHEIIVLDYAEKTWNKKSSYEDHLKSVKGMRFHEFTGQIRDIMDGFDVEFEIPALKKLKETIYNSTRDFSLELPFFYNDTKLILSYGIGGLHTIQENEVYTSTDTHLVKTSDYASLYPNIIINWGCIRFPEVLDKYTSIKSDRLIAKKNKEKKKDTVLKLILNSLSGMLDNVNSPLYYAEGALRMRIIGQLMLTKTFELAVLAGFRVISLNTDGLEVIVERSREKEYEEILGQVEKLFNIALEHDSYSKIIYANVNTYLGITTSGSIKRKGKFFKLTRNEKGLSEIPLGDSVDENIICRALTAHFVEGIDLSEYIQNPSKYGNHIYDYCKSNKISKQYEVFHNGEKVQNMNRYYFAKRAPYLLKRKKTKSTFDHVNVGQGVYIFNKFVEKPWEDYNIDYTYYVAKARKIVNQITVKERQMELF